MVERKLEAFMDVYALYLSRRIFVPFRDKPDPRYIYHIVKSFEV